MTAIAARLIDRYRLAVSLLSDQGAPAEAPLPRYAQQTKNGLAEPEQQVPEITLEAVADALVDFVLLLQSQRSFAVALVDARSGSDDHRKRFRKAMRGGVADILSRSIAHLKPARAKIMAIVLIHMLKGVAMPTSRRRGPR
ncbi:hypothetical protein [Paraburkholderia silvatlantica]|uniref:TetR family transcriptional regulator n=1 Tax=Paraburkholderia silvatlantica TaxID=321895 RepID=A0ABR6FSU1_9BURK|nr:hypothetical protein [Paraburkholderia silvatlantica]MBB2930473.1 hypothetical protein [Paraburkholderia silvatlantica]PVY30281.1 hypothetical protein C7411_11335 [Paraburkholderia silvatlantica]PXW36983.1 hypothetical protein C7413_113176 [Paraburkholderia silvatlantica]